METVTISFGNVVMCVIPDSPDVLDHVVIKYHGKGVSTSFVEQDPTSGLNAATDLIVAVHASTNPALAPTTSSSDPSAAPGLPIAVAAER